MLEGEEVAVKIYAGAVVGGEPEQTLPAIVSEGSWETGPAGELPDGTYTAVATQSNPLFEPGESLPVTFTVDTTPPAVSISEPANGSSLKTSRPTLEGGAGTASGDELTVTVQIHAGGSASGELVQTLVTRRSGGSWAVEVGTPGLRAGMYAAVAMQSDEAGNTGTGEVTFSVSPPEVSINEPTNGSTLKTSRPTFRGSAANSTGDGSTVTVRIYAGSPASGEAKQTLVTTCSGGSWSVEASAPGLPNGTYTAQASQSDEAGDTGSSREVEFKLDRQAPEVSITAPAENAHIKNPRPRFKGTAQYGGGSGPVTVEVFAGGSAVGEPVQTLSAVHEGGDVWSAESSQVGLPHGTYTARAMQTDEAGNVGKSRAVSFAVEGPTVSMNAPAQFIASSAPTFSGTASTENTNPKITVKIYDPAGEMVAKAGAEETQGVWNSGPTAPSLADGTYTAQAEQKDDAENTGVSSLYTFTVDTTAPRVTLTSPANGSATEATFEQVGGAAGTEPGDGQRITIKLFAGATASGEPLQEITVLRSESDWSATFAGLSPGAYTAQAQQSDEAGNLGLSEVVTFAVLGPSSSPPPGPSPTPGAPAASFQWFPGSPRTGENVVLVSNSTDSTSPIASYAWSLESGEAFHTAGSSVTTSFSAPGLHMVRLSVTNAAGLASVASETIVVSKSVAPLMQPFPVVRIAGNDTRAGVKLRILTVQAPAGAKIAIACKGRGCPFKTQSRLTKTSKTGVVKVTFQRLERGLPAGVTLEIRVSKSGQVGKYTRFVVRRHKLPERVDMCLGTNGVTPMACPS